jgi:DsbC/DsbD-like thiol-disulfide interchange protein
MRAGNNAPRRTVAGLAISLSLSAYSGSSAAAEGQAFASAWSGDARSAMRLIAGSASQHADGFRRAGVEIRLNPGWHTYWRYPGDAGVPPQFDFGDSVNIAAVHVLWPAPHRIPEHGLSVIGYTSDVVLPLRVAPLRPDQPVKLHLKLDYAVCQNICVPVQAVAELELAEGASEWDGALAGAEALVPIKRALRDGKPASIQSVRRDVSRSQVVVDIAAPAGARLDLFAEGPTSDWALPLPKPVVAPAAGVQRFAFDLDGAPPGASYEGAILTFTVAGEHPIEVSTPLE